MTQTSVAAPDARIICALDVPTTAEAAALAERIGDAIGFYKVGLQLFAVDGMALARELKAQGRKIFLDWKLHDIGATVEKATAVLAHAGCDLLTVHARPQVMAAAARGVKPMQVSLAWLLSRPLVVAPVVWRWRLRVPA